MTQTSGAIRQTSEVEQSEDAKQASTLRERVQGLYSSTLILCILVGVIALGFDLYRLGTPSVWFDEAFSVELARQPLPLLWHIIWGPEPNMELYYLILHFWLGFTSVPGLHPTEFVVRFPSAIFAALSSVMVFLLGRRFLGTTAGLVGAGLYILNNLQLTYAQQTRAYSLQLLLICIAWYALFTLVSQHSHHKRWWICYIAVTTLAIYSHLFTLVILLAQLTAFVGLLILPFTWRTSARKQLPAFIVSLVSIGLLSVPMLLVSLHGPKTGWLPVPHLQDLYNLFVVISANSKMYMLVLFGFCALGILVSALVYLPQGKQLLEQFALYKSGDDKRNAVLQQYLPVAFALLCWVVVPVVFSYVISQGSMRLFSTRYLVTILPALFLLVGLGVASLRWRVVQVGLALTLFLIALHYVPAYYKGAQIEDWNSTVHWLQHRYQPGDGLVCYDSDVEQGCQVSVEYYLHAYPSAAHFTGDSPGEFSWTNFGPANPHLGAEAAVDPSALAAYASQHSHFFYIIGRIPDDAAAARAKAAQNWLDAHYHLLKRIVTPTVTISWYDTNAQSPT
ncbi:MAG TPA: glycosyltransferase family 39 protein [Ktedonobacteraceae bacterium]|nr:glycosyltransferase family 39 protein [Ktedonobacteraceae bacterium]